jgi:uncharacterized protein YndB with AHSA1/START domain
MTEEGKSSTISTPGDREIASERVFDAPRDLVYRAYTDPELVTQWWGLRNQEMVVDKMELEAGGAWRFVSTNPDGSEDAFRGTYREISEPERLVYTFEYEGMPGHVLVETVEFEDLGERTRVKVHSLFDSQEDRDGMLQSGMETGMNEAHAQLDELLERLKADAS